MVQLRDIDLSGQAQGDLLFRDPALWKRLSAGTGGQFLKTQGPGAGPIWASLATAFDNDGQSSVSGLVGNAVGVSGAEYSIASVTIATTALATLVCVGMVQHSSFTPYYGGSYGYRLYLDGALKVTVSSPASPSFHVLKWEEVNVGSGSHTLDLRMWSEGKDTIYCGGRGVFMAGIKAS